MSNVFKVTDLVAKEALRIAHEKLQFIGTIDRQYDESFRYNGGAGVHGQTLRVKSPNMYKRRQGSRVMDVQDQDEATQTITVATQDGVDMRFNSQELIQSVDSDGAFDNLSSKYIEPAVATLVSGIEADFIAYATKATYHVAGTAGTALTDLVAVGAARAKLNQQLAPKDGNRYIQCDSIAMGGMVNGLKGLFQDSAQIREQYREGMLGRTAMADWYENDRMWTLPNSADVAGEINGGTLTSGITSLTVDGFTAAPVAGMVFTVEGVYDCHPETKTAYAHLKQFVVTSATTTSISFSPAMRYSTTDARQNCVATAAGPIDNSDITFVGSLSTNYVQQLMYHKEAYQFITADLPLFDDAQKCVVRKKDNLSLRVWMGSDIRNDELLMRVDILYGMAALRPEWGCRIIGAANT
jgi:P22 coat protein - gene protein 5